MDPDETLLIRLTLRNWFILALMLLGTWPWQSARLSLGVLCGGLVSIGAYMWQQRSLRRALEGPGRGAVGVFQVNYVLRLSALAATLFLLIKVVHIDLVGLAVGLSVVVVNIFWTTIQRLF